MENLATPSKYTDSTSVSKPPFFDGTNFAYWKDRMEVWVCFRDLEEWRAIKIGFKHPIDKDNKPISVFDLKGEDSTNYTNNMKAVNSILCALYPTEYNRISSLKNAKLIWDKLESIHEGTS